MPTATQSPPADAVEVRMTFGEHLEELRWRLVKSLVALCVTFFGAMFFYQELVQFIVQPHYRAMSWMNLTPEQARDAVLISGSYTKPIWAAMKLAFIVGLV